MVMQTGFSSPRRTDGFPAGLRVLVVDDDPTWLKILEKMLKKCTYEVTTCGLARDALRHLRERKDGFDIVISDVNMPDMDGFKLLEHVGLEMDLPVIMMSVDGETSRVMKGVQHGACDYLLKPIRMKELKNIWQHVVRKRMNEVRDIECLEDRLGPDPSNDGHYGDQTLLKKRKDIENKNDEKDSTDPSTKKARVVWNVELHQKFVKAVNQIGIDSDKVGPKKILDLMNVPWLTRENVASHLQKYRLYLSRIRKDDKLESSAGGIKNPENSPKESCGSFSLQNSSVSQQHDVSSNVVYPMSQLPVRTTDAKPFDSDLKSCSLLTLKDNVKPSTNDISESHKVGHSCVRPDQIFEPLETDISYASSFDSSVTRQYPWPTEAPKIQLATEYERPGLEVCFNQPTMSLVQQGVQADILEPAPHIAGPSISENKSSGLIDIKPIIQTEDDKGISQVPPVETGLESFPLPNPESVGVGCGFDMSLENLRFTQSSHGTKEDGLLQSSIQPFPLHPKSQITSPQGLLPNLDVTWEMKSQSGSHGRTGLEPEQRNQVSGSDSAFRFLGEELMFCWVQGSDVPSRDVGYDHIGYSDFSFQDHVSEVPVPLCMSKFGVEYEYPYDNVEYPFVDQGLMFS